MTKPNETYTEEEQERIDAVNRRHKVSLYRTVEIQLHIHELGYSEDKFPSLSTIKRIIKRNGLVVQNRKRYIRCKSKKRYTLLNPTKANEIHQMDNAWTATH